MDWATPSQAFFLRKVEEASTRPWKRFGYPKTTWLRILHICFPRAG